MTEECFKELNEQFSNKLISEFKKVYLFYKEHAVDSDSLIRKLHLGYTAMRPEAFDFVAQQFPWLEEFRVKYNLEKKLNFLETHGLEKKTFEPHIDGKVGNPSVMFNCPILHCTTETVTYWVNPVEDVTPVLLCENGNSHETRKGATPHLPKNAIYNKICEHSFTNKAALFRSDIYHGVVNNTNRNEYRIMMHWWFPKGVSWDDAVDSFKEHI